jgi:hypothetical protein
MNSSSLGCKFKQKFEILRNFELKLFELTRFYCSKEFIQKMGDLDLKLSQGDKRHSLPLDQLSHTMYGNMMVS